MMASAFDYQYNLGLKFEKIAALQPSTIAIRFVDGETVTYQQLNERANQIAHHFKKSGVMKQDVIAIFNNKTRDDFASMLACVKIGAIYTNLDQTNPADRLLRIMEICQPKYVLYHSGCTPQIPDCDKEGKAWIDLDADFLNDVTKEDVSNLADTQLIHGNTAAYIMFTSGSTGFPKGAVMTHDNVLRLINWSRNRFSIDINDVIANVNPIYFDNSVFDFYSALFCGASLVPIPPALLKKPGGILKSINQMGCTIWFSVPSLLVYLVNLNILSRDDFKQVRRVIFGGEGFPKPKLKELVDRLSPDITYTNVYGPTECSCICSSYDLGEDDLHDLSGILPLGVLNPDFNFLILDEQGKKVKEGETGELCLLGPCVGKGYYGNAELTEKSFRRNPYSRISELMYCTGDLVFVDPATSLLRFVARKDNQIKHQGYRIELDEIEAALYKLDYVDEVAVVYAKNHTATGRIIAAIVANIEKTEIEIIQELRKLLPEYMIPKKLIFKECLPKNQNGKIDRMLLASECQTI